MTTKLTVVALSAAFLLCGSGLAFAQTSATHGTGTTGSSMSTTPSTTGSGSTAGMTSGATRLSGPISSESQLKEDLQAKGYSDISDVKHEGNYYTANAKQGGHSVKLRVDASNGMVTQQPG